ncbi:hypothetical protein A2625_05790 [candidate division WOR-1 bacterium RIFCSPHIGHO2_01_FULL_53_15]|uniref:DUF4911 domain-containing protein n=1 Tax=candidate division WOR-1 bacterium RIFCSPHIGHO2_01_FULL_53_15 TaxID=1802564 RepID=A0A1F4Q181_UNCSA|nr:MAG: hypothetical protein A2625_05790 [candidate division WOR-1 bacterium RIFCSPHIGHO2_01_FULL_53_15]OGC13893.1 MAG: hypothetical protein A3D23_02430 [candidate division WOR-1 bacterium RIFCSPHIGHO2_02_FULL_53_26]
MTSPTNANPSPLSIFDGEGKTREGRDSVNRYLRVKKEDIYVICPFFEAFEGMAAIRTPKPETGDYATLKLMVSPDFLDDFEKVLTSLEKRVSFERVLGEN